MSKKNNLNSDEQVIRLIAAEVVIITVISFITNSILLMFLMSFDFAIRAFTKQLSPLAAIAKSVVTLLKLKPKPIFAAPKKFAAAIGFIFSITILLLFFFNLYFIAYLIGGILIFCAVLESVFKVCMGCYVYNWIVAPIVNKRNNY